MPDNRHPMDDGHFGQKSLSGILFGSPTMAEKTNKVKQGLSY